MGKFSRIMIVACQRPEEFSVALYSALAPQLLNLLADSLYLKLLSSQDVQQRDIQGDQYSYLASFYFATKPLVGYTWDLHSLLHKFLRNSVRFIFLSVLVGSFKGDLFTKSLWTIWRGRETFTSCISTYLIYKYFNISTFKIILTHASQFLGMPFFQL